MSRFEDEYKAIKQNQGLKIICEYLMSRNDMVSKLDNPKKSVDGMWNYIVSEAKKRQLKTVQSSVMKKCLVWPFITTMKKTLVVMQNNLHV